MNNKLIRVSEIKKGMLIQLSSDENDLELAESDSYLQNGIWTMKILGDYIYQFSTDGNNWVRVVDLEN